MQPGPTCHSDIDTRPLLVEQLGLMAGFKGNWALLIPFGTPELELLSSALRSGTPPISLQLGASRFIQTITRDSHGPWPPTTQFCWCGGAIPEERHTAD